MSVREELEVVHRQRVEAEKKFRDLQKQERALAEKLFDSQLAANKALRTGKGTKRAKRLLDDANYR